MEKTRSMSLQAGSTGSMKLATGPKHFSAPASPHASRRQSHAMGEKKYSASMHALDARRRSAPVDSASEARRKSGRK